MTTWSDAKEKQLHWIETKGSGRAFELRTEEGEIIAALRIEKSCGTLATAEIAEENWTFKRVGFLNPRVTIRRSNSEEDVAMYEPRFWGDGILRFGDGHEYMWSPTNFWATQWAFLTPERLAIFTYKPAREKTWKDIFKSQAVVDITSDGWREKNLGLLLLFGWYLVVMHEQEAAAGAAAATCS
jgi:hypothetical protein